MATYIYGPQACGKTTNAQRLADHFGCSTVIDDWSPDDERNIPDDALVLSNWHRDDGIAFSDAMEMLAAA